MLVGVMVVGRLGVHICVYLSLSLYIYIYIYVFIYTLAFLFLFHFISSSCLVCFIVLVFWYSLSLSIYIYLYTPYLFIIHGISLLTCMLCCYVHSISVRRGALSLFVMSVFTEVPLR